MLEPPWASLRAGPRHASRGRAGESDDRVVTRASLGPGRASRACPPASPSLPRGPSPGATPTPDPRPPGVRGRHQSVVPAAAPAAPRSEPPGHTRPHTWRQ